jgi:hypothetical protein
MRPADPGPGARLLCCAAVSPVRSRLWTAVPLGVALALLATAAAGDAGSAAPRGEAFGAAARSLESQRPEAGEVRDRSYALLRLGLLVVGGLAVAWAFRPRPAGRARTIRLAVLVAVGVSGYSSFYYFFQYHHAGGFDPLDSLQYYLGSKYADEIGYFGLYEAVFLGNREAGRLRPEQLDAVRDLRTLRTLAPEVMLRRAARQRSHFGDARWREFQRDLAFFWPRIGVHGFRRLLGDHGYNATPIWSTMGHWVTRIAPIGSGGFRLAVRADRVLVVLALLAVTWAYGPAVGALAALVWGTGFLWRYGWGGDSFLRQVWLSALLIGLSLLRRGRAAAAGSAITLSGLLRIFPAVFALGYLAHGARELLRTRRIPAAVLRFAAGALGAAVVLVAASLLTFQRGPALYAEFAEKILAFQRVEATNKIGLPVALAALERAAPQEPIAGTQVMRPARWASAGIRILGWILVGGYLLLYWRALRFCAPWEAALLAFALIPVLSQPTNYYYSFVLAGVLLAERRPRIGLWVVLASGLWAVGGLLLYREASSYVLASAVALALSTLVLLEMQRSSPSAQALPSPQTAPAVA